MTNTMTMQEQVEMSGLEIMSSLSSSSLSSLSSSSSQLLLSNHNLANIQKQKYIGTRKHNSEAEEGAKQEHRIKDSDGSRSGQFSENIQGTTLQATGGDNKSAEQSDAEVEQHGSKNGIVEPRSYWDVLVNG